MNTTEATFLLDGEEYVTHGGTARFDGTPSEWSDRFRALGGETAVVEPKWRTGAPDMTLYFRGTDAALAFVAETAPLATSLKAA